MAEALSVIPDLGTLARPISSKSRPEPGGVGFGTALDFDLPRFPICLQPPAAGLKTLHSYCSVCDSPDPCDCGAHRYLDEIVYKRTPNGWACPNDAERERFYNPPKLPGGASAVESPPVDIQRLVVELELELPLDSLVESELRRAYERNPRAVTLIVHHLIDETKAGKLRSPTGLLLTKLRGVK